MRAATTVTVAIMFGAALARADPDSVTIPIPNLNVAWALHALSDDGTRALLTVDVEGVPARLRVLTVDGANVVVDLALPVLATVPSESLGDGGATNQAKVAVPGLDAELRAIGPVLAGFPLGAADRLAAAPDGRHVAFVVDDSLYTAVDGKVVKRVAAQASYRPLFTPDGKALLFSRYIGHTDETAGYYGLFVTSRDGTAPPRLLAGTTGIEEPFVATGRGALRIIVSAEPMIATCVVEVSLIAPYAATKLGCLPEHERIGECVLSPRGSWLACSTSRRDAPLGPSRLRTMEVATGKIAIDREEIGPAAISEAGVVVLGDRLGIHAIDATGSSWSLPGGDGLDSVFRTASQLAILHGSTIRVVDTRAP